MLTEELLSIHAASERRRLTEASLEGPWQVPVELVRRAIGAGASRVEVELARGRVVVRDDGAPLPSAAVEDLVHLLDENRSTDERRAALRALEPFPALLAVAALKPRRITSGPGLGAKGTALILEDLRLDTEAARRSLQNGARFAPAAVIVDGQSIPHGFPHAVAEMPLDPPLRGRLALTHDESARLWLLTDGVVSSHVTLADTPAFEAAVEVGSLTDDRTPAALREAIEPHVAHLVDRAVRGMLACAAQPHLDEDTRRRLAARLLLAARKGWRAEVLRAPLFPAIVDGDARAVSRVALADLDAGRAVAYVDPGDDVGAYRLPTGPVLLLDADDRGRLAQLVGLRFRPLDRRQGPAGRRDRRRRLRATLGRSLARAAARLRAVFDRPLAESELTAEERRFVQLLRTAFGPDGPRLVMTSGRGRPHHTPGGLHLPRRQPMVVAAVRAVATDPTRSYVAALAFGDAAVPTRAAADAWAAATVSVRPSS